MRTVNFGKTFIDNLTSDMAMTEYQIGIRNVDGLKLTATGKPEAFCIESCVPTKDGSTARLAGISINPYNFTYEVRKYTETDTRDKLVIEGLTNPALNAAAGVVYGADARFIGKIEIVSSIPYRQSPVLNPNPSILQIPVEILATDTADLMVAKIQKAIARVDFFKDLFTVTVDKDTDTVKITVNALKDNRLAVNFFGIVADQEASGTVTVSRTKFSGYLCYQNLLALDARYSDINFGWNPHDEWQSAWGLSRQLLGDPAQKLAYCVISTAEFNQFPEIAADNNCPRKTQIIAAPEGVIDSIVAKLQAIKTLAAATNNNGLAIDIVP